MKTDWKGIRVLVIGAARQGQALARWLTRHGARVTLNDRQPAEALVAARAALADLPVTWAFGGHPLTLLDSADVVCLSGGVPLNNPLAVEALKRSIPLTNDTQIFMEVVPCHTIGITGSAGKTTTTTLIGRMAKEKDESAKIKDEGTLSSSSFVGGNIGDPLLNYVDEMTHNDLAILEISSFQLEQMTLSPNIAVILNITPNHLDRHGTMEAYTAAKARILLFQSNRDIAVLGRDDPGAWSLRDKVHGALYTFGFSPLSAGSYGTFVHDGMIYWRTADGETALLDEAEIELRGDHNRLNVQAACAIAAAARLPVEAIRAGVRGFRGVAHRLELVRQWRGVCWYNDSIATAPERTIAAIRAFNEPLVLLLGGRDKNLPWEELAVIIHQRVDHVVLFGEAAAKIERALAATSPCGCMQTLARCPDLKQAIQAAAQVSQPGDVVLLSPGGTSFDEFSDFEQRGEEFRKWVWELS
jgi:UDP-N-acetylmuramoylalanine--D-glutamate ligase